MKDFYYFRTLTSWWLPPQATSLTLPNLNFKYIFKNFWQFFALTFSIWIVQRAQLKKNSALLLRLNCISIPSTVCGLQYCTLSQKKRYDWLNSNSSMLYFFMKGRRIALRQEKIQHLPEVKETRIKLQHLYSELRKGLEQHHEFCIPF